MKEFFFPSGEHENVHIIVEESGTIIRGEPGAVLRGGVKAYGWQHEGGDIFSMALPAGVPADLRVLEIDGVLRLRTRYPAIGFMPHFSDYEVPWVSTSGGGFTEMPTSDARQKMKIEPLDVNWADVEATVLHRWDESLVPVQRAENDTVYFTTPCGNPPGAFGVREYALWNTHNLEPGRWRLDIQDRKIFYHAMPGEQPVETWLPVRESIIEIRGDVRDLEITGLTFKTTLCPLASIDFIRDNMPNTYGTMSLPGAIDSRSKLENSNFSGLAFENIGAWGIRLTGENSGVIIRDCTVDNSLGGGFFVKERSLVTGCKVKNIGLQHYSAVGIYAIGCDINGCIVENTPYSGIVGGGDGVTIESNTVRNAMQVLNDGAGVYATFGKNGIMRGNYVSGIPHHGYPSCQRYGLYIDEQAPGWLMEDNTTENCVSALLCHMHYDETLIRNNTFISDKDLAVLLVRCRGIRLIGNTFRPGGHVLFAGSKNAVAEFSGNDLGNFQQIFISEEYKWGEPEAASGSVPLSIL
ncbi:MAG: right-handed parallel beta-helix repeat-containing protein [Defluviitaleaceae bacterium]|nr:right-handed parallel beta-helix repeat-containing protein [Defluviitaleaceae bacterium]